MCRLSFRCGVIGDAAIVHIQFPFQQTKGILAQLEWKCMEGEKGFLV